MRRAKINKPYLLILWARLAIAVAASAGTHESGAESARYGRFEPADCVARINRIPSLSDGFAERACASLREKNASFNVMALRRAPGCENVVFLNGEGHNIRPVPRGQIFALGQSFPIRLMESAWDYDRVDPDGMDHRLKLYGISEKSLSEASADWKYAEGHFGGWIASALPIPRGSIFHSSERS